MKRSLKKEVIKYRSRTQDILKHFDKNGYSERKVSEYSCLTFIPLYVVYTLLKENSYAINDERLSEICNFYHLEEDYFGED